MLTQKQIKVEKETLDGLQGAVVGFKQIAGADVRKIRVKVLQNRDYLAGIAQLYRVVEFSYKKQLAKDKFAVLAWPKKEKSGLAMVFLSANTGLYGPIVKRTFDLFLKDLENNREAKIVVVGRIGQRLLKGVKLEKYIYFDFPDRNFTYQEVKKMVDFLANFSRVRIYHGFFENTSSQVGTVTDISDTIQELLKLEEGKKVRWIFEPSLFEIVDFFEGEIFTSLFIQAFYEGRLAKSASRMVMLSQAEENISGALRRFAWEQRRWRHRLLNQRQLATLAGMNLWSI